MKQRYLFIALLASCSVGAAFAGACSSASSSDTTSSSGGGNGSTSTSVATTGTSGSTGTGMGGSGSGSTSSSGTGGPPDCFMNPTTHDEIINACTDAQKIDKNPVLPLLTADGGLPPLP